MSPAALAAGCCLAVALGGTLYIEQRHAGAVIDPGLLSRRTAGIASVAADTPGAARDAAWVSGIVARPLFSPSRRPPAVAARAPAGPQAGLPRLSGVMISAAGKQAIFVSSETEKPVIAVAGDRIGGYLVRSIAAGEVVLVGPDGVKLLHPAFAPEGSSPENASATPAAAVPVAGGSILERLMASPPPSPPVPPPPSLNALMAGPKAAPQK